jgi:hypothetical protein
VEEFTDARFEELSDARFSVSSALVIPVARSLPVTEDGTGIGWGIGGNP